MDRNKQIRAEMNKIETSKQNTINNNSNKTIQRIHVQSFIYCLFFYKINKIDKSLSKLKNKCTKRKAKSIILEGKGEYYNRH